LAFAFSQTANSWPKAKRQPQGQKANSGAKLMLLSVSAKRLTSKDIHTLLTSPLQKEFSAFE